MSKVTLKQLGSLENQSAAIGLINSNMDQLVDVFDNTLSRDGSGPNTMAAPLDMNSNRLVNLPAPSTATEPLRLQDLNDVLAGDPIVTEVHVPEVGAAIRPAVLPDTILAYYAVTCTAGNGALTMVPSSPTAVNFTAGDVGKKITIFGIGPNEQSYSGTISAVTDGTHITVSPAPTKSATVWSLKTLFGTNQYTNLQTALTSGKTTKLGTYIPAGYYLVSASLLCLPADTYNATNAPSPLLTLDPGAHIIAVASMTSVLQIGQYNVDYSTYIKGGVVRGGTIDANFLADYAVDCRFFQVLTRTEQLTKNSLKAGCRYGVQSEPVCPGLEDLNNKHLRDTFSIPITSLTAANPPVVTTLHDHGVTTGRTVAIILNGGGDVNFEKKFFRATVTGAKTLTLDNTNATTWVTPFTSGSLAMCMPSSDVISPIFGADTGSPCQIQSDVHPFSNDQLIDIYATSGKILDGTYKVTASNPAGGVYSLKNANTGANIDGAVGVTGTYSGGGYAIPHRTASEMELGIYMENCIDVQVMNYDCSGVRVGIYNRNPGTGYDGKYQGHFWNYVENGEMLAGIVAGGDNAFLGVQVDGPTLFHSMVSGINNTFLGCELNHTGFTWNNAKTIFLRKEAGATATIIGGNCKAEATNPMLAVVICPEIAGNYGIYGKIAGLTTVGFKATNISYGQPNSLSTDLVISGTLEVTGVSQLTGNVTATGNVTVGGKVTATGNLETSGSVKVGNGALSYATLGTNFDAAIQYDATNKAVNFYTNNIWRGGYDTNGALRAVSFNVNGTPGFTGTKVGGGLTFTVVGGIITNITP
jgi:hypothetical protein